MSGAYAQVYIKKEADAVQEKTKKPVFKTPPAVQKARPARPSKTAKAPAQKKTPAAETAPPTVEYVPPVITATDRIGDAPPCTKEDERALVKMLGNITALNNNPVMDNKDVESAMRFIKDKKKMDALYALMERCPAVAQAAFQPEKAE